MSLDLFQQEGNERLTALPPVQNVDPGMFDGFIRGTGMATMRGFATTARAVDLLGAIGPITKDAFTGGTEAQDKYFTEHDAIFGRAVDYWTPTSTEVGSAASVVGTLLSIVPQVMISPSLAVGSMQLGTAEDLTNVGVTTGKAQAVGAIQGLTLGTGIWMPILGKNLWQRALIGGAGFNLLQGTGSRALSAAVIGEEHPQAKAMFEAFNGEALTLDILLGLAFGGLVHYNPTARVQGTEAWNRIESWAKSLNPSDKASIATLREAQHLNMDSTPGKPVEAVDIEAHVERMRAAIDQLATDQPVNVEDINIPRRAPEEIPQVQQLREELADATTSRDAALGKGDQPTADRWTGEIDRINLELTDKTTTALEEAQKPATEPPRFSPDPERIREAEANMRAMVAEAEVVRAEEGLPRPPEEPPRVTQSVRRTIEEELARVGRPAEEAAAGAAIWDAFYRTMAKRLGTTPEDLWTRFPLTRITNERPGGEALRQPTKPILEQTPEGPVLRNDEVHIAEPWGDSTGDANRQHILKNAAGERIGEMAVTWKDNQIAAIQNIYFEQPRSGSGERVIRAVLLHNKPETKLQIHDIQPESVDFWKKMGATITEKEGIKNGQITRASYESRRGPIPVRNDRAPDQGAARGTGTAPRDDAGASGRAPAKPPKGKGDGSLYQAGVKDTWYKSALGEAITNLNMKQGDAKSWLQALKGLGSKGVKAEEVKWSGIEEWLQMQEGKITKEQVQEFLTNNGVKVEEVILGNSDFSAELRAEREYLLGREDSLTDAEAGRLGNLNAIARGFGIEGGRDPKFAQYQLRGGENYREIALVLPAKPPTMNYRLSAAGGPIASLPDVRDFTSRAEAEAELQRRREAQPKLEHSIMEFEKIGSSNGRFQSPLGHEMGGIADINRLAHIRFNERVDADGRKVLFLEELQSDWAHKGKKEGFSVPEERQRMLDLTKQYDLLNNERRTLLDEMSAMTGDGGEPFERGVKRQTEIDQQMTALQSEMDGIRTRRNNPIPAAPFVAKREFAVFKDGKEATRTDKNGKEFTERYDTQERAAEAAKKAGGEVRDLGYGEDTTAWVALTLKRMIAYAAQNGFDRVAWTRGEQQVERYTDALRKAVDTIEWKKTPEGVQLVGYKGAAPEPRQVSPLRAPVDDVLMANDDLGFGTRAEARQALLAHADWADRWGDQISEAGRNAIDAWRREFLTSNAAGSRRQKVVDTTEKEDALSDAIGKAMAEKIISDPNQSGTIEGEGIRIDSTGMAGFYDRIVPKVAGEVLKKLGGGKVGETQISHDPRYVLKFEDGPYRGDTYEADGHGEPLLFNRPEHAEEYARINNMPPMAIVKEPRESAQQSFDITPAMKAKVNGGLPLFQKTKGTERGYMSIGEEGRVIGLLEGADASTFVHESGHFFLDTMAEIGKLPDVPPEVRADLDTALTWMGLKDPAKWTDMTLDEKRPYHEKFARGFEQYLREGKAPSAELKGVFQRFRDWLVEIYKSAKSLNVKLNDDIRGVLNRMLADQVRNPSTEAPPAPAERTGSPPPPRTGGEAQAGAEVPLIDQPQLRTVLQGMADNETGWAQIGGKLMDQGELGTGKPSFTTWIPKAEWWRERPDKKMNGPGAQEAVRKALAGEKLKPIEQRIVDHMVKLATERSRGIEQVGGEEEYQALGSDAWDEGLEPTTENIVDLDLVARATAIDEAYVERAAMKYENDDAAFRGELEMLIHEHETGKAAEIAGRSKAGEQPAPGEKPASGEKTAPGDIVRNEADLIADKYPDMPIHMGTDDAGNPVTMTAKAFLEQARAEADLNRADIPLLEVAAQCLLGVS